MFTARARELWALPRVEAVEAAEAVEAVEAAEAEGLRRTTDLTSFIINKTKVLQTQTPDRWRVMCS